MRRPTGKRVAILLTLAGVLTAVGSVVAWRDPILRSWHRLRVERLGADERWAFVRSLEDRRGAARAVAKEWYLSVLRDATPVRGSSVSRHSSFSSGRNSGFFSFAGEEDLVRAAERLAVLRSEEAIPQLVRRLEEADPGPLEFNRMERVITFHFTTAALLQLGAPAAPAMGTALRSERPNVRVQAALCLKWLGKDAADAVPDLLRALRYKNPNVQGMALDALLKIDSAVPRVVEALLEELRNGKGRWSLPVYALGSIGRSNPEVVAKLDSILSDPELNPAARWKAAECLGEIGPAAADAVPGLLRAMKANERQIVLTSANALGKIGAGPEEVVTALKAAVQGGKDVTVRQYAAQALGEIGPKGPGAFQSLLECLAVTDQNVRASVTQALGRFGKEAVPLLVKALSADSYRVRQAAALGLRDMAMLGMAADVTEAVPDLERALRDPDDSVRHYAKQALNQVRGAGS